LAVGLRDLGFDIPDAQGNFVWLPAGSDTEAYAATFARAGLMVRQYASGGDWDGLRITVGEPAANARVLEVAAILARAPAS
jgi:histidinol-phosphate aminotransferase